MAVGGDIVELQFNHPSLGSGTLFPKASEDNTFDLGGFRSNDDDDMIDGGGTMIDQINRKRWSAEITISEDQNIRQEMDAVIALAGDPVLADWTITHINGTVWKGKGKPVGDLKVNVNAATFPLKIAGGGKLKKIL